MTLPSLCYNRTMEIRQKTELRRLLVPQLRQSLNILALPLPEVKDLIDAELESNPLLEETQPEKISTPDTQPEIPFEAPLPYSTIGIDSANLDFRLSLITQRPSLQDICLRQLGMFTNTDEEFRIGQEIIGNIDENGYLKATLEEIAQTLSLPVQQVENVLKLIQQFEPAGVGAKTVSECLLIQLKLANENDPLLIKIVECHLEDVAKKNYSLIAKTLKEPLEEIEPLIKKVLRLNPKPGLDYSSEETQRVIPDIIIDEKDEGLEITINNEDLPNLGISEVYRDMLKNNHADPQARQFLTEKLHKAQELLRAISKRQATLRSIVEVVVQIQEDAIREDLSCLKPLTFQEVAQKLNIHESTVCRAVMNKYVKTPYGVVALKDFFSSHIQNQNGESVSSSHVKRLIKDLIEQEDKKHPLSDQNISGILSKEQNLKVCRRTVTKYREELKILSSVYRKER